MRSLFYLFRVVAACACVFLFISACDAGQDNVAVPTLAVPQVAAPAPVQTVVAQPSFMTLRKQRVVYDQQVVEEDVTVRQQRLQIVPRIEEYEVQVQVPTIQQVAVVPQIRTYVQTQAVCAVGRTQVYGVAQNCCTGTVQTQLQTECCTPQLTALQVAIVNAQRNISAMEADPCVGPLKIRLAKRALARMVRRARDEGVGPVL